MNLDVFVELSLILLITMVIALGMRLLKQPAIIGYILSGIVAGPVVFNIISETNTFTALAQKGVALLLFLVGLNMNPKVIKDVGKISVITGVGQVLFTSTIGFVIALTLGFSTITSLYIAIALTFSSTIVIMKLISDKKDLESLYAKISVGFLIVQDLIVIIILLLISSLGDATSLSSVAVKTLLMGSASIIALFILAIHVLPKLTKFIAKTQELLFLFSLTWCFGVATLFNLIGFSFEAGALLAGISLSVSPYHFEIGSKLRPLRDFFLILFFIILGSKMVFADMVGNFPAIAILSLFVLIGNPLIVMILMGIFGYTKRTGFHSGLTVAQISEFSLILIGLGVTMGHLSNEILSIATAIALITFAGSTYMIMYSDPLYRKLSTILSIFERKTGLKKDKNEKAEKYDIILFGCNRIGFDVIESLKVIKKNFLVIDHNPDTIARLTKEGFNCRYGDAASTQLLEDLNLAKAKMIISTIENHETNTLIIDQVKKQNKKAIISVVSNQIEKALELYDHGATYVIMPHLLGAKHFSTMISKHKFGVKNFLKEKIAHIEHISKRKALGHAK